jgi:hypothetical protein
MYRLLNWTIPEFLINKKEIVVFHIQDKVKFIYIDYLKLSYDRTQQIISVIFTVTIAIMYNKTKFKTGFKFKLFLCMLVHLPGIIQF